MSRPIVVIPTCTKLIDGDVFGQTCPPMMTTVLLGEAPYIEDWYGPFLLRAGAVPIEVVIGLLAVLELYKRSLVELDQVGGAGPADRTDGAVELNWEVEVSGVGGQVLHDLVPARITVRVAREGEPGKGVVPGRGEQPERVPARCRALPDRRCCPCTARIDRRPTTGPARAARFSRRPPSLREWPE